jgi:hypothetical protein
MTDINGDTMTAEDSIHFLDDIIACGFDTIIAKEGGNIIGFNCVGIDLILLVPEGFKIDTFNCKFALLK